MDAEEFTGALNNQCNDAGLDFVFGEGAIAPLSRSSDVPSALSHLYRTCNGQNVNYVMQPGLDVPHGETRRNITDAEKEILCTLGYKVESCDMCYLTVLPEDVRLQWFNTCCGSVITLCEDQLNIISHEDLLCNDFGGDVEITDFFLPGSSTLTVNNTGTTFEITPTTQGIQFFYYTVKSCDCRLLNGYAFFFIGPCTDCEEIDPCENLVCLNDFEEYSPAYGQLALNVESAGTHWISNGDNSLDICEETGGNNYLHIGSHPSNREGLIMKLSEPLLPGCSLHITFDASVSEKNNFNWYVSENPPCNYLESFVGADGEATDCGTFIFDPDFIGDVLIANETESTDLCQDDALLEAAQPINWPNQFDYEVNYVILFPGPQNSNYNHNYIDNIVITKDCIDASFDYEIIGECLEISFDAKGENPSSTFDWDFGDSNTSNTQDPTHTYSSPGTYSVSLSVTDECDNSATITHEVVTGNCCPDLIIDENTNWTTSNQPPSNGIFHTLTVAQGFALEIGPGVVLKFCPGGALIIEAGAYVRNQGTLTSIGDVSWLGVYVEGLGPTVSQQNNCVVYSTSYGCSPQGFYWGDEGSLIENAVIGVRNYGTGTGSTGGKIRANQATFNNNATSLHFASYQNFSNVSQQHIPTLSTFTDCTFSTTSTYPIDETFERFVRLEDVDGMKFVGCTFNNEFIPEVTSDFEDFGKGIHATGSAFSVIANTAANPGPCELGDCENVINSTFSGLGHGILVENATAIRPYTITQCIFENCNRGITSDYATGGTILYNEFRLGNVPIHALYPDQIGIYLDSDHSGFELQENNFIYSGVTNSIGIICAGLGGAPNLIRRNKFDGLRIAHEAFFTNAFNFEVNGAGLIYLCDSIENTDPKGYDFVIPDASVVDNIFHYQAEPINGPPYELPAGNNFAYTASDMHNPNFGPQEDFFYRYFEDGNQDPLTTGIGYSKGELPVPNECHISFCAPPCIDFGDLGDIKGEYFDLTAYKEAMIADYLTAIGVPDEEAAQEAILRVNYYKREAFIRAYTVVSHLWLDTVNFDIDTLIKWYGNLDTYGSDIMIAGELARAGRMTEALVVLEDIPSNRTLTPIQEEDLSNIIEIYNILDGTAILDLSVAEKRIIRDIAQANIGASSGIGKAILSYFGENHPRPYYLGEVTDPPIRYRNIEKEKKINISESNLNIFPVPASNNVFIKWSVPNVHNMMADLLIVDLYGRSILSQTILSDSGISLNVSNWNQGIYIATVRDISGKIQTKMFVVN
ncbi:MAG TPA: PKD domain-containing protein [Saprospiraceae bacterium]|nr:PKD domain-containing protein [Saprospiraceae bacterium]